MMSSEEFSSTEELYYEGSPIGPLYAYHQESQMRFYENVVYVQHVVVPAMLLEYIPVYINYQTYEPYLINRFQVVYVPFIRHTYSTYLVPYYNRLQTPELFPTSAEVEYNTPSNSYPEIISDQAPLEDSDHENCTNSSISPSDETSVVSWTSLDSTSSYGHSELTSTQETCHSLQEFLYTEHNDCFDGECDEDYESNIAWEYPQEFLSAVDAFRVNETDTSSLSLLFADDEKGSNELDSTGNYLYHIPLHEDRYVEFDVSSMSVLDEAEQTKCLEDSEKVGASSVKNIERGRNILPGSHENHMDLDSDIESCVLSASSLTDIGKGRKILPENRENHMDFDNDVESCVSSTSSQKNIGKGRNILPESRENHVYFDNDIESCVSSASSLEDIGKGRNILPQSRENHIDFDNDIESCVSSASSLKNIEKSWNNLPESRENHMELDNDIECCVSSASSLDYVERYQDENGLEDSELPSLKNENVKGSVSHSSTRISERSQEIPLQKTEALHKIDAKVPLSFDDVSTEKQNDNDTFPEITLEDILTSEENWKVKTEDCIRWKRSNQLYRSALQGDIRPKKSLPEVGALATIFEDLPFPVNEPYDDGLQRLEESKTDEFDLPPLDVERSNSSSTTLLPKKKRFRNTKKFFSGLCRCFRPR